MINASCGVFKYHQSKQDRNYIRISLLSNIEDKYNYDGIKFLVSYGDIEYFESKSMYAYMFYELDCEYNVRESKTM
jgi:hypothetical protein